MTPPCWWDLPPDQLGPFLDANRRLDVLHAIGSKEFEHRLTDLRQRIDMMEELRLDTQPDHDLANGRPLIDLALLTKANPTNSESSSMSTALANLERRKLVTRYRDGKRTRAVRLTPSGVKCAKGLLADAAAARRA